MHLHARHACTTRSSTCMHLHACMHDAELHGHLGLLMHAQLALDASSRRGTSLRGVKDVGVKSLRGVKDVGVKSLRGVKDVGVELDGTPGARGHAKGDAMPFEIDARARTEPMGAASYALLHNEGDAASAQYAKE
jgi:hypothetical protein